jgi:plastocyanin
VILVALATILGSVVAVYAFDLTDLTEEPAPRVILTQEYQEGAGVVITVETADSVRGERLSVAGTDPDGDVAFGPWPNTGPVTAGDTVRFPNADGDEEFRVVWTAEGGDRSFVLTQFALAGGERVFRMRNGAVAFEAEAFNDATPGAGTDSQSHTWEEGMETGRQAGASGGTYLVAEPKAGNDNADDTTSGPRLDYRVAFESAGTYYIWVRTQSPSGNDDSVHAGLDRTLASDGGIGVAGGSGSNWGWSNTVKSSGGKRVEVEINAPGVHTVNVWMREDGTPLDKVILTDDPGYTPNGAGADGS